MYHVMTIVNIAGVKKKKKERKETTKQTTAKKYLLKVRGENKILRKKLRYKLRCIKTCMCG